MKRITMFLICIILSLTTGWAQRTVHNDTVIRTEKMVRTNDNNYKGIPQRPGKWNLGGSFGMAFGDRTTITIAPQVSYSQSAYFALGGGVSYSYFHSSRTDSKYDMNYIGLNVFGRVTPLPYLVFQVQPEVMQYWGDQNDEKIRSNVLPTLLVGGGFMLPAGRGAISLMFYYDVIQNKYTPYGSNLFYSVGYTIGF